MTGVQTCALPIWAHISPKKKPDHKAGLLRFRKNPVRLLPQSELVVDADAADTDVVVAGCEGHIACAGVFRLQSGSVRLPVLVPPKS